MFVAAGTQSVKAYDTQGLLLRQRQLRICLWLFKAERKRAPESVCEPVNRLLPRVFLLLFFLKMLKIMSSKTVASFLQRNMEYIK